MSERTTIALLGYGKMGKEVERLTESQQCEIGAIYDPSLEGKHAELGALQAASFDVFIDFSTPNSAVKNIELAASLGKNIAVGTTGWYDKLPDVERIVRESGIGCIYAQNFSVGIFLFKQLVAHAAKLFNAHDQYDVTLHEVHHRKKLDAPSGTAHTLADTIVGNIDRKSSYQYGIPEEGEPKEETLYVSSQRTGSVPGTHSVVFDSIVDSIELTHTARSRGGLALGALLAAKWIQGKQGLYTIEDMLNG
ncbi:MAG: 4-hydroxy-tetrahydrodipicolinate reductase [Ectothiorhodospiraceae bacterium]|nr:4-hydroxy-tetrahydrodipicolinate reductase [Ectothiorhodospiraceae bacterium]